MESIGARVLERIRGIVGVVGAEFLSAEDRNEIEQVRRLFPEALDYTDVYERAGGLGPRSILAHAVHLSPREIGRLAETGSRIAHCPSSNLFLASGAMPLSRYLEAGLVVGLGSDVAGGPADDPSEIVSRLIFRNRPEMIRGAWVRGRLLPV